MKCGKKTKTQIDFCKTIPNVHLRFMYFRVASRTPLLITDRKNHKFTHFLSPRCFFFSSLPWRKYGGALISTVKKCWRFFVIIWKFKSKQTRMCLKRMTQNLVVENMQRFSVQTTFDRTLNTKIIESQILHCHKKVNKIKHNKTRSTNIDQNH